MDKKIIVNKVMKGNKDNAELTQVSEFKLNGYINRIIKTTHSYKIHSYKTRYEITITPIERV